jgi:hypothetical protein
MHIRVTLPQEGVGNDHLEVSERRVVNLVGDLGGRVRTTSTLNITPKLLDVSAQKVAHGELGRSIIGSLETKQVAETLVVEGVFCPKQPEVNVSSITGVTNIRPVDK